VLSPFVQKDAQKPPSKIRTVSRTLIGKDIKVVIQGEITGCGIAATAAIAGLRYAEAKKKASALGVYAVDTSLWSDTEYVRQFLENRDRFI
jgi:hypothetical protein